MILKSTSTPHWSVRTFLIAFVLAFLLPGGIGAAALFIYEYRESREQLEKNTILTARALAQAIDSHLLRAQAVAEALATSDSLLRGDFIAFHQRAREVVARVGMGSNVVLRDEEGRQLLNTAVDFGKPLIVPAAPDQVRDVFATGKPDISDLFIGPILKRPVMSIDVPVVLNGEVIYALGIGIMPENFNAILKAQKLPPGWIAGVFDRSGTIVGRTHSPEKFVGKKASARLLKPMLENNEGFGETTTLDGMHVLSFYSRSPVTGWSVAIGIPMQAIDGMLMSGLSLLAIGVAALFGIALALAWMVGGRIAYAIRALTEPAAALGRGDSVPVPQVQVEEAAEVASAIGRAADLLKQRDAELHAREMELIETNRLAKFGTWSWDLTTGEISASESIREMCGRDIPPFLQQRGTVLTIESWERADAAAKETVQSGKGFDLELEVNHGSGGTIWINAKCEAIRNDKGEVHSLRGTVQDITERKLAEQRVRDASLHDWLTGLPNRALIFEYGSHLLAAARRGHGRGALLFIDLDRFKPINDIHGHETGDIVLQEVGRRLRACTRNEDLVGRLGGDEFVIILPHLDEDRHRAAVVAQHVVDSISRPFRADALELSISPSIGISYFPEHAADVDTLIHTADLAMYQAKQCGRANFQFYTPELERRAGEALSIETRLRHALREGDLTLHYQPVVDIHSGRLIGAEALVRLAGNGSEGGKIPGPASFIPVAESTGLIGELGEWVAMEACRQHEAWRKTGLKIMIAINVSPLQFRQRAFAETLSSIIADTGMDPADLEIEVTESTIMESIDDAVTILNRIKSLGVKVALDDFGTGYSSLSSLSSLPLDKLKVDQSFVRRIGRDQASRAVTEAIIALGRSLKLDVAGEGIESEETLRYLQEHGCNQAQGYLFSQPLAAPDFARWATERWGRRKPVSVARG